jgi:hypothetical protein
MYFFLAANKESKNIREKSMATESVLNQCNDSLTRVQTFDASTLSREDDLGKQMSFAEAVKPAEAIIAVYKRIPLIARALSALR